MTSNVGSSVIEKGGGGLGFQLDTSEEDSSYNRIKTLVNEELKQYFRPEFLNRCLSQPYMLFVRVLRHTLWSLSHNWLQLLRSALLMQELCFCFRESVSFA